MTLYYHLLELTVSLLVFPFILMALGRPLTQTSLLSAHEHPDAVDSKLGQELTDKTIAGPFKQPLFSQLRISPQGVVPKKTPGEFRLMHHLSFP